MCKMPMAMLHSLSYATALFVVATMVTNSSGHSISRAEELCGGDSSGFNCYFLSNRNEYENVPVYFDNPLPSWLQGTLIRNGVGQFEHAQQSVTHVFDGFAKLSSWRFLPNGTTFFSTRFIRSNVYNETMNQDSLAPYLLFSPPDPPFTLVQKQQSMMRGVDNMNVNIYDFPTSEGGDPDFAAFSDYWSIYQFGGKDLSTDKLINPTLLGGESLVHMNIMSSAHPLPEPGTANRLTFLVRYGLLPLSSNRLSLVRMSSISGRSLIAEWDIGEDVPYMHSFSVTKTKAIMMTGPIYTNNRCLFIEASPLPCLEWLSEKNSTLFIVDLKTGEKQTVTMRLSMFAVHHINAYDFSENKIIMDVVSYDSLNLMEMLLVDVILIEEKRKKAYAQPLIKRIHIDLSSSIADVEDMSITNVTRDGLDMPAINEYYRSQHYCYVYGLVYLADEKTFSYSPIIKKDMCKGGEVVGSLLIPSHYPVEPAFVPNPQGTAEDDGVLLVPFLRGEDAIAYLAVVDAKTMTIISKADMPDFIPLTLHGRFYPGYY